VGDAGGAGVRHPVGADREADGVSFAELGVRKGQVVRGVEAADVRMEAERCERLADGAVVGKEEEAADVKKDRAVEVVSPPALAGRGHYAATTTGCPQELHRRAARGMDVRHSGHSLVAGAAGLARRAARAFKGMTTAK
jgi:hypothetical protein